jgi:aryl-alcohol dehydrogenase-like predicted oxidoreductase
MDHGAATERLGLGTVNLRPDRLDLAFPILDAWLAAGGRLIDTAAVYGHGGSELAIGAWLRARGTRDAVQLLTKGAHPDERDWVSRLSPEAIAADMGGSLERLGVPSVDAYLVHRDDETVPVGEVIDALAGLVTAGLTRTYGVSNWTIPRLRAAVAHAEARGLPPLTWSSSYFGLARTSGPAWPGVVDATDAASLAWYAGDAPRLLAWSPGGNGFFAADADLAAERFDVYRTPANLARRARAAELGEGRGVTAGQIALAWVVGQPMSPIALVGTTSGQHLAEAIGAAAISLTREEMRWLEDGPAAVELAEAGYCAADARPTSTTPVTLE